MIIQHPKIRSLLFGAIGSLLGGLIAEVVLGEPDSLSSTVYYGLLVGTFVGGLLGCGEFLLAGNFKRLQRAAPIAFLIGAVGGGLGASCGQLLYQATTSSSAEAAVSVDNPNEDAGNSSIFRRIRQAGGKEGAIEIGLEWNDTNDLDLHVLEPGGNRIFFGKKISGVSRGHLDVDRNAACADLTSTPVEHIYWDSFDIPDGRYRVFVHFFDQCGVKSESDFTVLCKFGDEVQTFEKSVRFDPGEDDLSELIEITSFVPADLKAPEVGSSGSSSMFQIIGWTIFGLLLGTGVGAPKYSIVAIRNAGLGGLIGGLVGGILFVLITDVIGQTAPLAGRLIGMVVLGILIGVMIAIVESALSAGLKFISGPFEGREILIVKPQFTLGRHELEDEYIGGDMAIVAQHASVVLRSQRHVISAQNGSVAVNDTPCSGPTELSNGDRILIGKTTLIYRGRASSDGRAASNQNASGSPPPPPPPPPPPRGKVSSPKNIPRTQSRSEPSHEGVVAPAPPPRKEGRSLPASRSEPKPKRGKKPPPPPPPRKS